MPFADAIQRMANSIHDCHKLLLWKTVISSLPTKSTLSQRLHIQNTSCTFCHSAEETINHFFLHPPFSTIVWSLVKYPVRLQAMQDISAIDWIRIILMIKRDLSTQIDIQHEFLLQAVIVLDTIWQYRNSYEWQDEAIGPKEVADIIIKRTGSYVMAWTSREQFQFHGKMLNPPKQLKFSSDVAIKGQRSWVAAVCMNSLGSILYAWIHHSSSFDHLVGEMEAVSFAIECAKTIKQTTLFLHGDSKFGIEALLSGTPTGNTEADCILQAVRNEPTAFDSWEAIYICTLRKDNFLAHNIVQWASFCNFLGPAPISSLLHQYLGVKRCKGP